MKINLLFVAPFPDEQKRIEGFIQRVKEIDNLFSDCERVYLEIRFLSHFNKNISKIDNVTIFKLNWLLHFLTIIKLLKQSNRIFIHSVYSGFRIFPHLYFASMQKAKVCLDLHGTFQEELEYKGEKWNSKFFGWIEKQLLKRSNLAVFVSKQFESYFLRKYPFITKIKRFIIPTCSSKVFELYDPTRSLEVIEKFNISNNDVVFVYSGSTEIWQKIDLMLETIKELIENYNNYKFFLLTANVEDMMQKAVNVGLHPNERLFIFNVPPENLGNYYEIAHYGFVLRDDHILNEVSSPTKFLEYLFFGVIPILKSTKIGDFTTYDIDFLTIKDLKTKLQPTKSEKNKQVANFILNNYKSELSKLKEEFLSD